MCLQVLRAINLVLRVPPKKGGLPGFSPGFLRSGGLTWPATCLPGSLLFLGRYAPQLLSHEVEQLFYNVAGLG